MVWAVSFPGSETPNHCGIIATQITESSSIVVHDLLEHAHESTGLVRTALDAELAQAAWLLG